MGLMQADEIARLAAILEEWSGHYAAILEENAQPPDKPGPQELDRQRAELRAIRRQMRMERRERVPI